MTTPYTRTHTLRWPAAGLTEITISTLPLGLMRKLRMQCHMDDKDEAKRDSHGFSVAIFKAATGLDDDQRGALTKPDLNSLTLIIHDLVMKPSHELVANFKSAVADEFPLLVPVVDVMRGQDPIPMLTMVPPTVRLTDSIRTLGRFEQERELVAVCTSITPLAVDALHMPDWVALQERVNDFLEETADYFRQEILKG
jgi:hypothetical protein